MPPALRAGVIGASGIGKHHAKWLDALSCEVVAFAGTSEGSVAATSQMLGDLFGFTGRGYVGIEAMLDAADPDVVAICSPPWLHCEHFLLAAERGCHIMCEKPLVWDPDKEMPQLLEEAGQMVEAAREKGIVAAVNTQYVAAVEPYLRLCEQAGAQVSRSEFSRFFMRMDSRGGKDGAAGEKIWLDLASHPLSVLTALAGPGAIVSGAESCSIEESAVNAVFRYAAAGGWEVEAQISVCNVREGPLVRRFGVDDVLVDYDGRSDEQGVFSAYLTLEDYELKTTDFVESSIGRFIGAVRGETEPLAPVTDGLRNLEMQLELMRIGRA